MSRYIIWGGTGQSIVVEDILAEQDYELNAIFDNNRSVNSLFKDIPISHGEAEFKTWLEKNKLSTRLFVTAIAGHHGKARVEISKKLMRCNLKPINAIHSKSYVSSKSIYGKGIQIMANATVNPNVNVGDFCIINTGATVDHECKLGDGVHIGPGATLAGCVKVGDYSFIGAGSTVLPRISIGKNTIVGAGSVVTKDLPDNVVAYGVPAKIIRKNEKA